MKKSCIPMLGLCILLTIGLASQCLAQKDDEQVRELGATITGNKEQPKVLYIVPWKSAYENAAVPYQPVTGQIDTLFAHTERGEHLRHLQYLQLLKQSSGKLTKRGGKIGTSERGIAAP